MTKNQKSKLERYAELKTMIATYEKEVKALQDDVLKTIEKQGKTETPYGTFNITERPTYIYSENVQAMAENLKIAKIEEEEQGIAQKTITNTLRFTIAKI